MHLPARGMMEVLDYRCWLARFADTPCDGRMDRVYPVSEPGKWVPSCQGHRVELEVHRTLKVPA
jgi:hypothetical protein